MAEPMAIRAKTRHAASRRPTATASRRTPPGKRDARVRRHHAEHRPHIVETKAAANHVSSYSKALRFLNSLADFERLRIVRYNSQNFDLERMRTLLKRLGSPQEKFKSVHV